MFSEDYIMRMISQVIAALHYLTGFKKAGKYEEAQQLIDQNLEILLGLRASLIRRFSDENILQALTMNGRLDVERLVVVAVLFREEAELHAAQGEAAESQESSQRALNFFIEVGLDEATPIGAELKQDIEGLVEKLGLASLSDDTLWALFCFYERAGAFLKAETALQKLLDRPGLRSELLPELRQFYERLLELPEEDVVRGGLGVAGVRERLGRLG